MGLPLILELKEATQKRVEGLADETKGTGCTEKENHFSTELSNVSIM